MVNKKGVALIFVLGVVSVLLLVALSYVFLISSETSMVSKVHNEITAYHYAEGIIASKLTELKQENFNPLKMYIPAVAGGRILNRSELSYGQATVELLSTGGGNFLSYKIKGKGVFLNTVRYLESTVRYIPISYYTYFTDDETMKVPWPSVFNDVFNPESSVRYYTNDLIDGPYHTNGSLYVIGNPVFAGPVTTVGENIERYGYPGYVPDFRGGLTLGVPVVEMPSVETYLNPIRRIAAADTAYNPQSWVLEGNTEIEFMGVQMRVKNYQRYQKDNDPNGFHAESLPSKHALYIDGELIISGALDGQLTIGSSGNIVIDDNLTYTCNPLVDTTTSSDDVLGLVAGRNVIISAETPSVDVDIQAYIVTLNGGLYAETAETVRRGTLTIFGGVASKYGGLTGVRSHDSTDFGSIKTGYNEVRIPDKRLGAGLVPPYFPVARDTVGVKYQKVSWVDKGNKP